MMPHTQNFEKKRWRHCLNIQEDDEDVALDAFIDNVITMTSQVGIVVTWRMILMI